VPLAPGVVGRPVPAGLVVVLGCAAQFMVVLDTTIVNVALPAMRAGLGLSAVVQQWIVEGYLITFGGFLLLAARASDLLGRRRVFLLGLTTFTASSLVGGAAASGSVLLAARALQGVGAAALAPASLSLITTTHPPGPARTRALAWWSAVRACAGSVGMVLGGLLTTIDWRLVLLVNVPIGVVIAAVAVTTLEPQAATGPARRVDTPGAQAATGPARRVDTPGALTATAGVGLLVYGVSTAAERGWASPGVWGPLVLAGALIAMFLVIELHSSRPLVPLGIFRHRGLWVSNLVMAGLGMVMTSTVFFLSLYLQQAEGYSAARTGLAMVPLSIVVACSSLLTRRLRARTPPPVLVGVGGLIAAAGVGWLSYLPAHVSYPTTVLGPTVVIGLGFGLMVLPITVAATADVSPQDAGLASGLVNMGRQLGVGDRSRVPSHRGRRGGNRGTSGSAARGRARVRRGAPRRGRDYGMRGGGALLLLAGRGSATGLRQR
jgi:EmrB/QacA subfamily drug resistance transporter